MKCQLKGREQKFLQFFLQNKLKEHKIIHVQSLFTFLGFTILYLTRSSSKLHYSVYGVVNFLLMLRRIKRHVINMLLRGADKAYSRNVKFHVKYNFTTIKGFSFSRIDEPTTERILFHISFPSLIRFHILMDFSLNTLELVSVFFHIRHCYFLKLQSCWGMKIN